ncbi:hypothetical protein JTE90_015022 [Oedothorax gibbosus]|uniref:Uncharacterized protein n=1 Tax=Oedothorax gibbosus TaxID=931172 RepID=A0AAV6TWD6_9ARAC|nr:hypothetical protein JTE90_015022 [Oedothorax gibbosus]
MEGEPCPHRQSLASLQRVVMPDTVERIWNRNLFDRKKEIRIEKVIEEEPCPHQQSPVAHQRAFMPDTVERRWRLEPQFFRSGKKKSGLKPTKWRKALGEVHCHGIQEGREILKDLFGTHDQPRDAKLTGGNTLRYKYVKHKKIELERNKIACPKIKMEVDRAGSSTDQNTQFDYRIIVFAFINSFRLEDNPWALHQFRKRSIFISEHPIDSDPNACEYNMLHYHALIEIPKDKSFGDVMSLWINSNLIGDLCLIVPTVDGIPTPRKLHPEVKYDTLPESKFPEINELLKKILSKIKTMKNPLCLLYQLNDTIMLANCPLYIITDIYTEQDRSARMTHNKGTLHAYKPTLTITKDEYEMPLEFEYTGHMSELHEGYKNLFQKGIRDMINQGKFKSLTYEFMELLTSKSQGDKVMEKSSDTTTSSRFLAMLIHNSWLSSEAEFVEEIKKRTISSNRSQLYRRTRMVAAVNNAKQFFFMIIRLVLTAAGKYDSIYALGKQTELQKQVSLDAPILELAEQYVGGPMGPDIVSIDLILLQGNSKDERF